MMQIADIEAAIEILIERVTGGQRDIEIHAENRIAISHAPFAARHLIKQTIGRRLIAQFKSIEPIRPAGK